MSLLIDLSKVFKEGREDLSELSYPREVYKGKHRIFKGVSRSFFSCFVNFFLASSSLPISLTLGNCDRRLRVYSANRFTASAIDGHRCMVYLLEALNPEGLKLESKSPHLSGRKLLSSLRNKIHTFARSNEIMRPRLYAFAGIITALVFGIFNVVKFALYTPLAILKLGYEPNWNVKATFAFPVAIVAVRDLSQFLGGTINPNTLIS